MLLKFLNNFVYQLSEDLGSLPIWSLRKAKADRLLKLGTQQYGRSQFIQALEFWQEALTISREIGDRKGEATSLGNLGRAYHSLGQYHSAMEYHQQSLTIYGEIGIYRDCCR